MDTFRTFGRNPQNINVKQFSVLSIGIVALVTDTLVCSVKINALSKAPLSYSVLKKFQASTRASRLSSGVFGFCSKKRILELSERT